MVTDYDLYRRLPKWLQNLTTLEWWPFVTRRRYNAARLENYTLRDSLRNANAELRKHRKVLGGLRDGDAQITAAIHRAISDR